MDATIPWVGPVVGTMIRLQSLTGMRSQSVCGLRGCDLVVRGGCLIYVPPQHKGTWRGKALAVPLGPRAVALLLPWLERDPEAFVFSPQESEAIRRADQRARRKSRVQPSQMDRRSRRPRRPPGDSYDTQSYYRAIQRGVARLNAARAEAGFPAIPAWHPHQLRHAVATEVRKRFGLEAAQVYLGHSRADVTQVYAEKNLALAVQVSREIG